MKFDAARVNTPPTGQNGLLLVVDDEEVNRKLLSSQLRRYGFEVELANDAFQALQMVSLRPLDAILLDIMMPEMDGVELCRRFKHDSATSEIPVLLVTALNDRESRLRGIAAGADDYLQKPVDFDELSLRVSNAVQGKRLRDELRSKRDELEEHDKTQRVLTDMLAHDLRGQLTGICGSLDLISTEGDYLNPDHRKLLTLGRHAAGEMAQMVSNVIGAGQLDGNRTAADPEILDLEILVSEVLQSLTSASDGIQIESHLAGAEACADRVLTKRIFENFVGNAVRFVPHPGGEINIYATAAPTSHFTRICVRDNGPGLPPNTLEAILEGFPQNGMRARSTRHSSGLGLAFCKLAAETQGGAIGATEDLSSGSEFWIDLPALPPFSLAS